MFCDLQNFTPISEQCPATTLRSYSHGYETQTIETLQMLPFQQQCVRERFWAGEGDTGPGRGILSEGGSPSVSSGLNVAE